MNQPAAPKARADSERGAYSTKRYLRRRPFDAGDRFLDLGANICSVANWVAEQGCEVLAYEPFPLALKRAKPVAAVRLVPKAVTADGRPIIMSLSKAALARDYTCSAHVSRAKRSDAIQIDGIESDKIADVLANFQPTCGKIDIEGGEYEVIPAGDFSRMHTLFVEFHGCNSPTQTVLMTLCLKRLWMQGLTPTHGWALNAQFDPRNNFRGLTGVGFWREVLFQRGTQKPENMQLLLDGVKRILDSGDWGGPRGLCAPAAFDQLVKETLS